jgi:D-galacturonate reductase
VSFSQVTIVGGGMITHDQILPSLYHLQRQGAVGEIAICALQARPLKELAESELFARAFPGQSFRPYPEPAGDLDAPHPDLYQEVIAAMPPRQSRRRGGSGPASLSGDPLRPRA